MRLVITITTDDDDPLTDPLQVATALLGDEAAELLLVSARWLPRGDWERMP